MMSSPSGQSSIPNDIRPRQPDLRFLAHRMADEIMKAYGEKSVFESKIAFVSDRDGNLELYMMDYDGANQTRITFNKVEDIMPRLGRPTEK